jgi:hypothetical protein
MKFIVFMLDMLIPRFITEDVALIGTERYGFEILCALKYVEPDDDYNLIGRATVFNLFGLGLFPRLTHIRDRDEQ